MDAEAQPSLRQLLNRRLELVVLRAQGAPAVDAQEDLVTAVVGPAGLAAVRDALHLRHDAAYDVAVGAAGEARHVGEVRERGERTTEIEDVPPCLERAVGQRRGGNDGA